MGKLTSAGRILALTSQTAPAMFLVDLQAVFSDVHEGIPRGNKTHKRIRLHYRRKLIAHVIKGKDPFSVG